MQIQIEFRSALRPLIQLLLWNQSAAFENFGQSVLIKQRSALCAGFIFFRVSGWHQTIQEDHQLTHQFWKKARGEASRPTGDNHGLISKSFFFVFS